MALMQGKGTDESEIEPENYEEKSFIPKEDMERIKRNKNRIKANFKQMAKSKELYKLLAPINAMLIAEEDAYNLIQKYKTKAKSKEQKIMAEEYGKTIKSIIENLPDTDELTEEVLYKMMNQYNDRISELREIIKEKGKVCPEYAEYRAYRDYLQLCQNKLKLIQARMKAKEKDAPTIFSDVLKGRKLKGMKSKPSVA